MDRERQTAAGTARSIWEIEAHESRPFGCIGFLCSIPPSIVCSLASRDGASDDTSSGHGLDDRERERFWTGGFYTRL